MNLITGHTGLLGGALLKTLPEALSCITEHGVKWRLEWEPELIRFPEWPTCAFLCAGTKGFAACEGNQKVFQADVDGNIRLARHLHLRGTFIVFVSTDAVEMAAGSAYARNRFFVELAIGGLPRVAIFRPGRFDASNVADCAKACAQVGLERREGLTRWP